MAAALPAEGVDLATALTAAIGSIGDAGGVASHLCARPSVLAAARNTGEATGNGWYPDGIGAAFGVEEVGVPELRAADILVVEKTRAWLVVRNDFAVDYSRDWAFDRDAIAMRLRGRFAAAAPDLPKSLRRLEVGSAGPSTPASARTAKPK